MPLEATPDLPPGPWLLVGLGDRLYGLPVPWLREALPGQPADPVPGAPPGVRGIMHVRGEVMPVVDLRVPLAVEGASDATAGKLVVVEVEQERFALRVDRVADVVKVQAEGIEPRAIGPHPKALCGFARLSQGLVQLVDPRALLALTAAAASATASRTT
jgi:purine-binding chemotaxis protein CheW